MPRKATSDDDGFGNAHADTSYRQEQNRSGTKPAKGWEKIGHTTKGIPGPYTLIPPQAPRPSNAQSQPGTREGHTDRTPVENPPARVPVYEVDASYIADLVDVVGHGTHPGKAVLLPRNTMEHPDPEHSRSEGDE